MIKNPRRKVGNSGYERKKYSGCQSTVVAVMTVVVAVMTKVVAFITIVVAVMNEKL